MHNLVLGLELSNFFQIHIIVSEIPVRIMELQRVANQQTITMDFLLF